MSPYYPAAASNIGYYESMYMGQSNALNVFVDSVAGSDGNDGLTAGTALQTIAAVYQKFPVLALDGATITVNLAAGAAGAVASYPVTTIMLGGYSGAQALYRYRGPAMALATLTGTGVNHIVGGLTFATVGRRTTITVAPSPTWTVNNLRGKFARIRRGADQVFYEIPIAENTANVLTLDCDSMSAVGLGTDTLDIVTPGAKFTSLNATLEIGVFGCAGFLPTPAFWGNTPTAAFERCHLSDFPIAAGVHGLTFDRCTLDNTPFFKGGNVGFVNTCLTLGIKLSCMSMEFATISRPDSGTSPINTTVSVELMSANLLLIGNPDGVGQYLPHRNVGVYGQSLAARGAIHVVGGGSIFWADDGSSGFTPAAVALFGSGNAGPFVWAVHGGQARIGTTAGATPFTVGTGTGNPLRVGKGAAIAYGTAVGAFEEAAGFNGNFHRMFAGTVTAPTGDASRIFVAV